jgi:hypothetical protein
VFEIQEIETWNHQFFVDYVAFKNRLHQNIPTSFPDTVKDYERFFSPFSVYATDFEWTAFVVFKNNQRRAQAILCRKKGSLAGNVGFLDWEEDPEAAQALGKRVFQKAQQLKLQTLKTPVDINFFIKYRIRCPGRKTPLFGEPVYPDYYHRLFISAGFEIAGEWDTYQVRRLAGIVDFFKRRKRLTQKNEGAHSRAKDKKLKTTIRCIRMQEWDRDLRIIFNLFTESYQTMPEFESISFEQFKAVYDDFRYLIHPWMSYIVELQGRPVGFSINFVDPLPILKKYHGRELSPWQKFWLFIRLRFNYGTFMISHIGKIPGPGGEEIKGIQAQVSRRITLFALFMPKLIVTFQNVDSPSRRSWNPKVQMPYARYLLYGKTLE